MFEEVLRQEKEILKTIQKQKTPFSKEKKIPEKVRQMFYLWQEMTLCKALQVQEKNSDQTSSLIEDPDLNDEYYEWSDNLEHALLAIDSQSQESDISSESDKLEESSDDEQVLNIFEEQPIDLTMQSSPTFRSVRGKSYQRGIQHNCGLSLKTSHGKFSNMVQQVFKETFEVVSITSFSKVTSFII